MYKFTVEFGFLITALTVAWGWIGAYYFYNERNILAAAFILVGILQIIVMIWIL